MAKALCSNAFYSAHMRDNILFLCFRLRRLLTFDIRNIVLKKVGAHTAIISDERRDKNSFILTVSLCVGCQIFIVVT